MKIRDENMNFVKSKTDLFRLIDDEAQTSTSKVVLFLILGTIFLDAYDITILGTMTDQLTQQFHLSPATLSIVMTLSLIHISEPTRLSLVSRMPSSA